MSNTIWKIALAIVVIAIFGPLVLGFFSFIKAFVIVPCLAIFKELVVLGGFLFFAGFLAWILWGNK